MSKRFHQTVLALSLGLLGMGTAHAQLVIDNGPAQRPASSTVSPAPTAPVSPSAGLLIVDGYDVPKATAPPATPSTSAPVANPNPSAVVVATPTPPPAPVLEVGKRPANLTAPKGWADGVPLSVALRQVIPAEYGIFYDHSDKINTAKTVSWSGGRPWNDVLATVQRNGNVRLAILWDSKTVTVVAADQPALTALPSAADKAPAVAPTAIASASTPVLVTRPLPVTAPAVQTWRLDPAKTLRENVEAWVKQAGWNKLVWEGADYPIYGAASFTGSFDAADGPLAKLIDGFSDSKQPLLVRLTTMDRVVHVYNKNYQPVEIEATSAATLAPDILKDSGVKTSTVQDAQQGSSMSPININDRSVHH